MKYNLLVSSDSDTVDAFATKDLLSYSRMKWEHFPTYEQATYYIDKHGAPERCAVSAKLSCGTNGRRLGALDLINFLNRYCSMHNVAVPDIIILRNKPIRK